MLLWFIFLTGCRIVVPADLLLNVAEDLPKLDGSWRLDYSPPVGFPEANTVFKHTDIQESIQFSELLPGTKYEFILYTNSTLIDSIHQSSPVWEHSIATRPEKPSNLTSEVQGGELAIVNWEPPAVGEYTEFNLKLILLSEPEKTIRDIVIRETSSTLQDLTPGATYEIQLVTIYENKKSEEYLTTNFTTQPNAIGRFIVWFRNETRLSFFWKPPFNEGFNTYYRFTIDPQDATTSEINVRRNGNPPSPQEFSFTGLVPGRAYNISVETVSEGHSFEPIIAQYQTVPLRPNNVTFEPENISPYSFTVKWSGPNGTSDFDKYQVALGIRPKSPQKILRGQQLAANFTENLRPGRTYRVVVKTVSGRVVSWPATGNVTTRPLPVRELRQEANLTGQISLVWEPNPESQQDSYRIKYHELETLNGYPTNILVKEPYFTMENILPDRNYSISVWAISNEMDSTPMTIFQSTSED